MRPTAVAELAGTAPARAAPAAPAGGGRAPLMKKDLWVMDLGTLPTPG